MKVETFTLHYPLFRYPVENNLQRSEMFKFVIEVDTM